MTTSLPRRPAQPVFATSAFWTTTLERGLLHREPSVLVHAKTLGTTTTICGQSTLSWTKFWHIKFAAVRHDRCPTCTDVLIGRRGGDRSDGSRQKPS
jgi:hypothetical protein